MKHVHYSDEKTNKRKTLIKEASPLIALIELRVTVGKKTNVPGVFPGNIPACHTILQLIKASASEIQYSCFQGIQSHVHWENTQLISSNSMCGEWQIKAILCCSIHVCINSGARCFPECNLSPNGSNIPTFSSSGSNVVCHLPDATVTANGNIHHALKTCGNVSRP